MGSRLPARLAALATLLLGAAPAAGCGAGAAVDDATVTVTAPAPLTSAAASAPVAPAPPTAVAGRSSVQLTQATALHASPGGRVVTYLRPHTEFHSPTVLPIVRLRAGWYGVISAALPNGRVGWIAASAPHRLYDSGYSIAASLRKRQVVVRRGGRVVLRFPVAIGAPGTPTPTGQFAVTDKLLTESATSPYGCCILALSARQPNTPQGWGGGDRVAIHATDKPSTIGSAASLGCLRAPTEAMRRVVRLVPLGTIVTISA
jgi:lipoprotein-anchoring transpeptidase ErfK/SrfK